MLQIMGLTIFREIVTCLQNSDYFSIMADETCDSSNHEQFGSCIKWVDNKLEAREDFIGLHNLERADASSITALIKDCLIRMNLSIHKAGGQCYDGCSTMSGAKTGVATQMKKSQTRCLYCHCYGHSLNLACADFIREVKIMKEALDTTYEITKLVKKILKRNAKLQQIKEQLQHESSESFVYSESPRHSFIVSYAMDCSGISHA